MCARRSQWRDRAGFAPASSDRCRLVRDHPRIRPRACQQGGTTPVRRTGPAPCPTHALHPPRRNVISPGRRRDGKQEAGVNPARSRPCDRRVRLFRTPPRGPRGEAGGTSVRESGNRPVPGPFRGVRTPQEGLLVTLALPCPSMPDRARHSRGSRPAGGCADRRLRLLRRNRPGTDNFGIVTRRFPRRHRQLRGEDDLRQAAVPGCHRPPASCRTAARPRPEGPHGGHRPPRFDRTAGIGEGLRGDTGTRPEENVVRKDPRHRTRLRPRGLRPEEVPAFPARPRRCTRRQEQTVRPGRSPWQRQLQPAQDRLPRAAPRCEDGPRHGADVWSMPGTRRASSPRRGGRAFEARGISRSSGPGGRRRGARDRRSHPLPGVPPSRSPR